MKRILLSLASIIVCLSTVFTFSACASKEKEFSELYAENVSNKIKDGEITEINVYTDSKGGELAEISVKLKQKEGYSVTRDYYLVVSDITFDADEIELTSSESKLYGSSIKTYNGKTVEKGYFYALPDLADWDYKAEYNIVVTWKRHQAKSSDKEYNIEKINKQIENLLNEEE